MSGMMNKIADALTGHHNTNATNANTNAGAQQPIGNQTGGVGTGMAGTNYSAQPNGALKEGAQVRDTGLNTMNNAAHNTTNAAHNTTGTTASTLGSSTQTGSSHLGRDAALAGGVGAGAGALASHHHNSASSSSLNSSTMGSSTSTGMQTGMATGVHTHNQTTGTMQSGMGVQAGMAQDGSMTRSEEHLLVGKEKVNVGTAALNKYVTTEKVSTAVPIIREHAVVEREPITDANRDAAMRGPDFKEAHYEVNLMEERAVAEKEVVPIERVRLRKEVEQTQQYVEAELRKEHIELVDNTQTTGKTYNSTVGVGSTATTGTGTSTTTGSARNL